MNGSVRVRGPLHMGNTHTPGTLHSKSQEKGYLNYPSAYAN